MALPTVQSPRVFFEVIPMFHARSWWACVCYLALALCPAHSSTPSSPADKYLSDHRFPGLHILERSGETLSLYPEGERIAPPLVPVSLSFSWRTMQEAREALAVALSIPPREPYQTDWAVFDSQGHRIESVELLRSNPVSFVLEIGQWMWPAVRVGFEHVVEGVAGNAPKVIRTLSLRPVVFRIEHFIQLDECDEVIKLGTARTLLDSTGVAQSLARDLGTATNSFRTSKTAWFENKDSPLIEILDRRVANLTRIDRTHNEDVQFLRYDDGGFYHGHEDFIELELFPDQEDVWKLHHFGHQDRLATVFWYLNDVEVGGETTFLKHGHVICETYEQRNCEGAPEPEMDSCDVATSLKSKPSKGTVIMWYNFHPSGRGDRNSLHTACPVGKGLTKFSGNKWINIKPVKTPPVAWDASHPALKRFKWVGSGGAAKSDPNKCSMSFSNKASDEVEVVWLNPDTGEEIPIISIAPGAEKNMSSFNDHQFKARCPLASRECDQQSSNPVACDPGQGVYVVEEGFSFRRRDGSGSEQCSTSGSEQCSTCANSDPIKCSIRFANKVSDAVEVVWLNPDNGEETPMFLIAPGAEQNMSSFNDHQFKARCPKAARECYHQSSNTVACDPGQGVYVVLGGLYLRRAEEEKEEEEEDDEEL